MEKLFKAAGMGLTLLPCLAIAANSTALAQETNQCDPIGMIVDGTDSDRVVCAGERVTTDRAAIQLLCFRTQTVVEIPQQAETIIDSDVCNTPVRTRRCGRGGQCFNPRTPGDEAVFAIITPDLITADPRPVVTWEPVQGATGYTVKITGSRVNWRIDVSEPRLEFPAEQESLKPGQAYEVVVIARYSAGILATARGVINIVDPVSRTLPVPQVEP